MSNELYCDIKTFKTHGEDLLKNFISKNATKSKLVFGNTVRSESFAASFNDSSRDCLRFINNSYGSTYSPPQRNIKVSFVYNLI